MNYESIRQSKPWEQYLKFLKWNIVDTTSGIKIAIMRTPFGTVSKIQRPKNFCEKDLEEIEEICTGKKCIFNKIEPSFGQDESLLTKRGYVTSSFPLSPPSTMLIELEKSEEELWGNVSKSGKYSVNRARREGNNIKVTRDPKKSQLDKFYVLVKATGKRGKFYVQPYKDLLKKRDIFKEDSFLIEVYDSKGELVSAKVYFGWKGIATFLHGGTTKLGRKGKGGYLLMWESILYFKKLGYKYIDLEGIDDERFPVFTKNWGGFSHFKEKFGGTVLRLPPPYIKYYNPVLKFFSKYQELPL